MTRDDLASCVHTQRVRSKNCVSFANIRTVNVAMALASLPSCWRLSFWDRLYVQCGNSGVYLHDALAPPMYPLKPRRSKTAALKQRFALEALHKENMGGLDYLRKQEQRGRNRERKPRRKPSCKETRDIAKFCAMLASFLLAPKV